MSVKKIWIFTFGMLLIILLGASFLCSQKKNNQYLAVIPHFMIMPERVSEFYAFLKKQYFSGDNMPDHIVLLSPNHFFPEQKSVEGLCKKETIKFKNQILSWAPFKSPKVNCEWGVFYFQGEQKYTKDHGLGEHFRWIHQYFPSVKNTIPLALPSHNMQNIQRIVEKIKKLPWTTFVIASVDFSHYLPEAIALKNDQLSFSLLQTTGKLNQVRGLDVDCPACLGVLYRLAEEQNLQVQQWLRDSSSTIVGRDLKEENTSRQFLWWKTGL